MEVFTELSPCVILLCAAFYRAEGDILSHQPGRVSCITAKLIVQCRLWVKNDQFATSAPVRFASKSD